MNLNNELYRKSLHFLLILVPISFCYLGKSLFLSIFVPITLMVVGLDHLRGKNQKIREIFVKILGPILRPHELSGEKLCGASWVFLGICLTFALFKKEIAVTGFIILVISDAAAALIGKAYPSQPFFEKTFNGASAFFVTAFAIVVVCGLIFDVKMWFYLFGIMAVVATTIIESRPSLFKIDDNFTIPVAFSAIVTFFDMTWNYSY